MSQPLTSVESVVTYATSLRKKSIEVAWFLFLDERYYLQKRLIITNFSDQIKFKAQQVVRAAHPGSKAVIIVHNHLSQSIWPSKHDLITTQRLALLCYLIDVPLLDHIIVTQTEHFSFRQAQLFNDLEFW